MKRNFHYIFLFVAGMVLISCKKDNKEAPSSTLSGQLKYNGEAINVEHDRVPYELYQFGFGKVGRIGAGDNGATSTFAQDGSYSALLFDGDYKFTIPAGQGPFMWKQTPTGTPDSIAISLRGNQVLDIEVTPYYMIRSPQFTAGSGKVNAIFKVEKIITDSAMAKSIENVQLYINKTQFVSGANIIKMTEIAGADIADLNNITLVVDVPTIVPTQNYVFARVGLKIAGVEDRIYTPVQKIQL